MLSSECRTMYGASLEPRHLVPASLHELSLHMHMRRRQASAKSSKLLLAPEWLFSHFPYGDFFPSFRECHADHWGYATRTPLEQRLCMPTFRVPVVMVHMAGLRCGQWGRRGVMRALGGLLSRSKRRPGQLFCLCLSIRQRIDACCSVAPTGRYSREGGLGLVRKRPLLGGGQRRGWTVRTDGRFRPICRAAAAARHAPEAPCGDPLDVVRGEMGTSCDGAEVSQAHS